MTKRLARLLTAVLLGTLAFGARGTAPVSAQTLPLPCGIDVKVLVIAADGQEAGLPAITAALGHVGTPYEVYVATQNPGGMTSAKLANGCRGFYQGVILTTGNLGYDAGGGNFQSALTPAEFDALAQYEALFGIRQATWYTYPSPDLGFNWPTFPGGAADTSSTPLLATLTTAGAELFPDLTSGPGAAPIAIKNAYTYLSTPLDLATTPLLQDDAGHALMALHSYEDGRMNLAMTFDSNPYQTHSMLLSYGVVNWVMGGLFIGDRHVYMSPQVDDLFIDDVQWLAATPCGTNLDTTGVTQRVTGKDLDAVVAWQSARRLQPTTANARITMAFNGLGTTSGFSMTVGGQDTLTGGSTALGTTDTLTSTAVRRQSAFYWVSHTFNHANLDAISYADALNELTQNTTTAKTLGLTRYTPANLVQPDVSGLGNAEFLRAAHDSGLKYLVSDTSKPGQGNPLPNIGFFNPLQPDIFVIPRRANNLFFNVAAPADWVGEYNCLYRAYWGRDLSYAEILDVESEQLVSHLFRGELDPWMFHQTNLAAYDGTHTLLGDLIDATLAKYNRSMTLPIQFPSMDALGARMANRTIAANNGVSGRIDPGKGIWLTSPVAVTVPVTGVKSNGSETYGGQSITWVALKANTPQFVAWADTIGTLPPTVTAGAKQTTQAVMPVTLSGTASDPNVPVRPITIQWVQTSGPAVTLVNADQAVASFITPKLPANTSSVTLGFSLIASNGLYASTATTSVVVKQPKAPTAWTAPSQTVNWSTPVVLTGSGYDQNIPPRAITYSWAQTKGPAVVITNADQPVANFVSPALAVDAPDAVLGFTLTVSNGALSTSSSTSVTVRAPNSPIAKAVASTSFALAGTSVSLLGTGTDTNTPALPLTFRWAQTGGPAVTLRNADQALASFTAPRVSSQTTLTFTFTVTSPVGSSVATVKVSVR